jgi:hypothetical protein
MNINIGIIGPGRIADTVLVPGISQVDGAVFWSVLSRDLFGKGPTMRRPWFPYGLHLGRRPSSALRCFLNRR